jgi:hypothetical protein
MSKKQNSRKILNTKETTSFYEPFKMDEKQVAVIKKGKSLCKRILILCEGETEVNYFKGITESETYKNSIIFTVIVTKPDSNQAKNLILLAMSVLTKTIKDRKLIDLMNGYLEIIRNEDEQKMKEFIAKINSSDSDNESKKRTINKKQIEK